MMLRKIKIITLFLFSLSAFSQETLMIEEAIKIALEKNYNVLIAGKSNQIAKTQNNISNAGMTPEVSLNAGYSTATLNSHLEFNTGAVQDRVGASNNALNASVNVNWVIFDGLRMFAVKKRLTQTEQLSSYELKQQMENTVYDIILAYYDIVRIKELIKAAEQNLLIYQERKKLSETKISLGSDSKVDLLLTRSDENKAKSSILQLELQLITAKANLNTLLARPADTEFETINSIESLYSPSLEELKKSASNNTSVLISKQKELIVNQTILEARSVNLPFVQLNGAYNFTRSQNQAGIIFLNRQNGPSAGVSAAWLLFQGGRNRKYVQERQIELLSQKYFTEQSKEQIGALVYISYQNLLTNKKILELEKQNLADSKEVLTISLERYKLGKSNLLETIETQKNMEDAQVRHINALYELKKSETGLLRSNGSLVK
jgi:outer membrane protein